MIFTRYLINIILRNQLFVLLVLFLILFSQKFIRSLHLVVDDNISKFLIFIFFTLGIPEIMKLVLPISLFISILITFNYLQINHEIIAMYSCGMGNIFIVRGVLFVSSITTVFSMINVLFLSPFCLRYQNQLMLKYQSDFSAVKLITRQFQFIKRIHSVCFIDTSHGNQFKDIFFVQIIPDSYCSIIVADYGCVKRSFSGDQWIVLNSGNYYFWNRDSGFYSNFCINSFDQYKFLINRSAHSLKDYSADLVAEMFINQLWFSSRLEARVELHWRLTLIIVSFVMAMIIFPLSLTRLTRLNNSYLMNVFSGIILYLVFFLLQIFLRSYVSKGYIDLIWIWIVNFFYVFIAVVLNFWSNVNFRNFRWKLKLFYMNV